jgi:hypothetical protein
MTNISVAGQFNKARLSRPAVSLQKLGALLFLVAIALIPIAIVAWGTGRGGIFVAGYIIGVLTAPIVAIGMMRAVSVLADSTWIDALIGFLIAAFVILIISVGAALWSLFFM